MPATRNRTQAPTSRTRHRSLDGSTASIPSVGFESADEEEEEAAMSGVMNRGAMTAMLADSRTPHVHGEEDGRTSQRELFADEEDEEVEDEEFGDDGDGATASKDRYVNMPLSDITSNIDNTNPEQESRVMSEDDIDILFLPLPLLSYQHSHETDAVQTHSALPPRGLKEISSLASWTVSTSKPGCGVAALRSPDTSLFWQSDGPQPHLLSIHFFKLVSIAHMRIFLDFDNDESYTPTKMQFLAGMGVHDVQEFCEMTFEQPRGWIDVDFSQVGPVNVEDEAEQGEDAVVDWESRATLKCFLVQVRILENHQNGKDTHLRGLQIFARDERADDVRDRRSSLDPQAVKVVKMAERPKVEKKRSDAPRIRKASWMMEPELR